MVDINSHSFELLRIQGERWAAASYSSPYFFFTSDTREGAIDTVKRALSFYMKSDRRAEMNPKDERRTTTVTKARKEETILTSDVMEAA